MKNPLLRRQQCVVEISHAGSHYVSKDHVKERIAKELRCKNSDAVVLFGFRTAFGGAKTTGFCLAYDDLAALKKVEPKHRMVRAGIIEKPSPISRKQIKNQKNRRLKKHGVEKSKVALNAKK